MRKTSSTCVRVWGNFFVLSTILKQRNRASRKMVYYKKAPMLLNGNLANDSGQETIFVEWELLKVNLFVCFVCLFFFLLRKTKSEFYLSQNTNVYSSKKSMTLFVKQILRTFTLPRFMAEIPGKPSDERDLASPAQGALDFDNDNVRGELYQFKLRFVK